MKQTQLNQVDEGVIGIVVNEAVGVRKYFCIIVLILFFLVLSPVVFGFVYCDDLVQPNVTCQLVTPALSCDVYNYSIVNESGNGVLNGSLVVLDRNIYYLNFTQNTGRYVVRVCDNSSKQLKVGEDNMSVLAALVLLPVIFGFLILKWLSILDDDHKILKNVFGMFGWFSFVVSAWFGSVVLAKYYGFGEMLRALTDSTYMIIIVLVFVFTYWMLYYLMMYMERVKKLKDKKLNY